MQPGRAPAAQRGRGNGDRFGHQRAAGVSPGARDRDQCPGRRAHAPPGGDHRHPRGIGAAVARGAAGRHGSRVQPHPQWRHGAQPAAGRHPGRTDVVQRAGREAGVPHCLAVQGPAERGSRRGHPRGAFRRSRRVHRLSGEPGCGRHQGRHLAAARVSRRRGERAVHSPPGGDRGRAGFDPCPARAHRGARPAQRAAFAHVLRPRGVALVELLDAPADRGAHPPRASALPARRLPRHAAWHPARSRGARRRRQCGSEGHRFCRSAARRAAASAARGAAPARGRAGRDVRARRPGEPASAVRAVAGALAHADAGSLRMCSRLRAPTC